MATLTELQTRLDSLKKQKHSGVARVTFNGRTVEYRSNAEITEAIAAIDRDIAALENTRPLRMIRPFASKGL